MDMYKLFTCKQALISNLILIISLLQPELVDKLSSLFHLDTFWQGSRGLIDWMGWGGGGGGRGD